MENSFKRGLIDKKLFINTQGNDMLIVQIYVDDFYLVLLMNLSARNFSIL